MGCTDSFACNYDANATVENESCVFPPPGYPCGCTTSIALSDSLIGSESIVTMFEGTGVLDSIVFSLEFLNLTEDQSRRDAG